MPSGYKADGTLAGKVFKKGFTPWNKGKTGKDDARITSGTNHPYWKNGDRTKTCPNCEKKFQVYYYRKDIAIYCSNKCRNEARIGKYTKENNPNWKGGRFIDNNGYALIYHLNHPLVKTNGYIFEHRLVIERKLGRYLLPEEKCHHLGAKDDNRLMMLMAFSSNSAHRRFHKDPSNVKSSEIIIDGKKSEYAEDVKEMEIT